MPQFQNNNPKSNDLATSSGLDFVVELHDQKADTPFQNSKMAKSQINFVFCLDEPVIFEFEPVYKRKLNPNMAFIIYNPDKDLPFQLQSAEKSRLVWLHLRLDTLHNLFVPDVHDAPIFNPENSNRKIYEEKEIHSELIFVLNQLFNSQMQGNARRLFFQGKVLEILSVFLSEKSSNVENCPFLNDEQVVRKIRKAKDYLLQEYQQPPTLPELAKMIELNESQLKIGFKEIYGNTPYQFLLDHKLEIANQLLLSQKFQVNEVADKIGYTNVSHFIDAFKKKYGVTPKKIGK
jgi:AraC-like DNA-binding protein